VCEATPLRIAWELDDQRPLLLLLHPFPFDRRIWAPQVEELAQDVPVLTVDLPGFGQSPPASSTSLDSWADHVDELVEEQAGGRPVVVAGLSMGGYVALRLAERHPERLEALILADTRSEADTQEARATRERAAALVRSEGVGAVVDDLLQKLLSPKAEPELVRHARNIMLAQTPDAVATALLAMRDRPDSTHLLADIRVPTLVIVGSEDVLTPPADAESMYRRIPSAWLVRIPGAGHLSSLEAPEEFNAALRGFLASL